MVRLLRLTTINKKYLAYFSRQYPHALALPYEAHLDIFENDSFAEVGFWKLNLEKLGGYEVAEHYIDYELLQKKWAAAHHLKTGSGWLEDILEAQIEAFRPDIIFENDARYFDPGFRERLKRKFPFIRHFIAWDGYIRSDIGRYGGCDLLLTCVEVIRQRHLQAGLHSEVLPFGFEPSVLERIPGIHHSDISFVGNIIPEIHTYRLRSLYKIWRREGLDLWLSNFSNLIRDFKRRGYYYKQASPGDWRRIWDFEKINRGEAYGLKMYDILHGSRVTLNIHGDGVSEAGNMRLIEACGSGACLLTDDKPNIGEYFVPGEEIVVFKSAEDAVEKIRYLDEHEDFRRRVAAAGQQKVLDRFSFFERAKRLNDLLGKL